MEVLFNISNITDVCTKSIKRMLTNSVDEETFINSIANELLMDHKYEIKSIIFKMINKEIYKRENMDLRKKLLITNQLYNNLVDNINNIFFNIAKEYYDNNIQEISTMTEPTQNINILDNEFETMVQDDNPFLPFNV